MLHSGAMCMGIANMATKVRSMFCGQNMDLGYSAREGKLGVYKDKVMKFPSLTCKTFWQVGRDDPRRMIHAFKVGLSLTLVSLLYLVEPLFNGIGQNAMWAVMTVVVVLEFTAGATLCKGLNRGLGTLLAGSLGCVLNLVANKTTHVFRAVFVASAVFVIGAAASYVRFIPYIKKNYDYGVVIFLLTFNLITVSSYRVNDVLKMAQERFFTIAMGCAVCLLMSLLVFPNWSGEDLHDSTVSKLEGLAKSIEACVDQYFKDTNLEESEDKVSDDDPIYKAVLDSKTVDETLALYASWEPRYCFRFPWKQYVKIGVVLRHFGYTVVALHGCLQTEIQTPKAVRALFKDPCIRLAAEVSKVLTELATSIKNRRHCSPSILSDHLHETLQDLDSALKSQPRLFLNPTINNPNQSAHPTNFHALAAAAAAASAGIPKQPTNVALQAAASAGIQKQPTNVALQGSNPPKKVAIPSSKTDTSALLEWKNKKEKANGVADGLPPVTPKESGEKRTLRPTLSKIAITSLEFAEALPFAAFASLLVEIVARLDHVIEEVEELGRIAHFKEFRPGDEVVVNCGDKPVGTGLHNHLPSHGIE